MAPSFMGRSDVTFTAQTTGLDFAGHDDEHHALLLVALLRTSRLSLLYSEADPGRTALLRLGVLPLLSRRAHDQRVVPTAPAAGTVVPFPDRRSCSSIHSSKRRREIVVYFDNWTDTPLTALRDALCMAVATPPADLMKADSRLSEILEDLGRRFDTDFIVLLDRFEDLLQAPSHQATIDHFADELAEAINEVQAPANFLIASTEEARPRLAGFRARIPGFDDFSLRLLRPHDRQPIATTVRPQLQAIPVLSEPLPALADRSIVPTSGSTPTRSARLGLAARPTDKPKIKRLPLSRVQMRTEDVYAMIQAALSRIAIGAADPRPEVDRGFPGQVESDIGCAVR